jgi:hypothetical protein
MADFSRSRKSSNVEYAMGRGVQKTPYSKAQKEAFRKGNAIEDELNRILVSRDAYKSTSTPEEQSAYNKRWDQARAGGTGSGRASPSLDRRIKATGEYMRSRKAGKPGWDLITPQDLKK